MNAPFASADSSAPPAPFAGWTFWLALSLVWGGLGVLSAAQSALLGNFEWSTSWYRALTDWGPWVVLAPPVWWLALRMPISRATWLRAVPAHVALAVVLSIGIELLTWLVPDEGPIPQTAPAAAFGDRQPPGPPSPPPDDDHFRPFDKGGPPPQWTTAFPGAGPATAPSRPRGGGGARARLAIPIYFLLVAAAHAVAYHQRSLERERTMRAAETSLVKARLGALQTQLQPHFFFNALNAVAALIHTRPDLADKMICSLADLMRGVLDVSDQPEIPLRRELAFIDHYLSVQKIRFGDRLAVAREIDDAALDCLVPPLLLQPLVENAVVHGVEPRRHASTIVVRARRGADGRLLLAVINSHPGASRAPHPARPAPAPAAASEPLRFPFRVGLANTRARLVALHGSDYRFEHRRAADGGVSAEIDLPARTVSPSA